MDKELYELVKRISRFQDSQWEEYIISQDRYYRYFGKEDIYCIREKAHELGEKTAGEVQRKYGNLKKALEASQVNIRMAEDQEFLIPGRICFGQYYDNEILVSSSLVRKVQEHYEMLQEILGKFSTEDIITAHELYHHFEDHEDTLTKDQAQIQVRMLPFVKKHIVPDSAGEISAFSFTKIMTGLKFHPRVLELLSLWDEHKDYVCRLADTIENFEPAPGKP